MNSVVRARIVAIAVVIGVVVFAGVLATRPVSDTEQQGVGPLVGAAAPTFRGIALDGRDVDLASHRGKYVVVNFFATWCMPCIEEHPELRAFSTSADAGLVAIAYDQQDLASARKFFAENGGSWPILPDPSGKIALDYGVHGLPETYVVDPSGKVVDHRKGKVTQAWLVEATSKKNS